MFAILASMGLGLLFALAEHARRPVARLVRAVLIGLVAMLTLAGLVIGVTSFANEAWWALILAGAILLVAARLGWTMRRRRPRGGQPFQVEHDHVPLTRALPDLRWQRFEADLDWVGRKQARQARAAIQAFVSERDSASLTPEHRTLLLSCEKRVPELIDTCLDRCRNARPDERRRYMDQTLDTLSQLGLEAGQARREVREADDQRLRTLHRYFEDVAPRKEEPR